MKLIVNADDFGFSEAVTQSIIKCHQEGIVTSTTILAGAPYFEEAIQLVRENPKLGIGVHLALDGPLNIRKGPSSLIDPQTQTFFEDMVVERKIITGALKYDELVAEYAAQIEKVKNTGITITHLDHHHHFHLYFPILKAMITVAKKYGIPFIRSQKILLAKKQSLPKKVYRSYHQYYLSKRLGTTAGYTSLIGCSPTEMHAKFQAILSSPKTTIELMVHPLPSNGEIDFLTNPEILWQAKNHLINYADLARK